MADDKKQTLDIPLGTIFEFKDGKLVFGHDSDIVIRTNLGGYKFQKIFSKRGSVQVLPPEGVEFDVDEIEALNGDIFLNGRVRVRSTHARTVHFQEGQLIAEVIEGREEVVLQGARVQAIHVKAPKVTIDPEADGLVLVVESQNEVGRTRARGGFRSVAEARQALEHFHRLFGSQAAGGTGSASAAGASAPPAAASPVAASQAVAAPAAAPPREDANATYPGVNTGGDSPVLPKSSVFRKRT